jgi:methionyl-tRNA formyltransferase
MTEPGWRVALISTVPPVVEVMTRALRDLGHEPVAVVTARRTEPIPERPSISDETAPAGLDVLLARDKWSMEPLLRAASPDLALCWGFPWRIPQAALDVPRLGSVNCHPALLPRHRGPIPMAWAIRDGDGRYGVTWHRMDSELDTGPILAQASVPMEDDDFEITDVGPRIGAVAVGLLPRVLARVAAADPGDPQPADGVSWAGHFAHRRRVRPGRHWSRRGRSAADRARPGRPRSRLGPRRARSR